MNTAQKLETPIGGYKVHIICNGCDRRLLDAAKTRVFFEKNNCTVINQPEEADYILFYTCGFSQSQENTCINLIKQLSKNDGELIVLGCLPALAPSKFKETFSGRFLHSSDLNDLDQFFPDFLTKFQTIADANDLYPDLSLMRKFTTKFEWSINFFYSCLTVLKFKMKNSSAPLHRGIREGAYLRISGGCFDKCTYCAIPNAIGGLKSKPLAQITKEYQGLIESGQHTFIFSADNVGSYGIDSQTSFSELLQVLSKHDQGKDVKWIIGELHPIWAVKHQDELLKHIRSGKIIELMIPVQSGSERILKLMKRDHNLPAIEAALQKFRSANPKLRFNTDIIIGFPSETDGEFNDSIDLVTRIGFDQLQLFRYTDREGTRASELSHKIAPDIIVARLKKAMKILDKTKTTYLYL